MRILVTGASGMLGRDICPVLLQAGHDCLGVDVLQPPSAENDRFQQLDITDHHKTHDIVSRYNPDLIIHAAGYTDVDGCEKDPALAYRVNGLGTRNLLIAAQRFDAAFVYISTDYVFGDDRKQSYRETDAPNPMMEYARSKLLGEQYVQWLSRTFYIIRISWLFGRHRKNYMLQMIESITKETPYSAATDMVASPTYTQDLAHAIAFLIQQNAYGIYHITNAGHPSRYDIAQEIMRILGKGVSCIKPVMRKDLALPAKRPKSTVLENHQWQLNGFPPMRHWKEALVSFLSEL